MTHLEYRSQMLKWLLGSYAAYVCCFFALPFLAMAIDPSCKGGSCAASASVLAAGILGLTVWIILLNGAPRTVAAVFKRSLSLGGPMPIILSVLCDIWFAGGLGVLVGAPFMLVGTVKPKYYDFPVLMLFAAAFLIYLAMPGIEHPSLRHTIRGIPLTARHAKILAVAVAVHATLINAGSVLKGFGLTSAKTAWMAWASRTPMMSLITWADLALFCFALRILALSGRKTGGNGDPFRVLATNRAPQTGFGKRKTI